MRPRIAPRVLLLIASLGLARTLPAAESGAAAATADLPVFRSVLIDGQSPMFSLSDATGSGRWVQLGESFEGWKLEGFDATKQLLTISRDGATRELGLEAARLGDSDAAGSAASLAEADALLQKMRFEEMIEKTIEAQQSAMAKSMSQMPGMSGMDEAQRERFTEFQRKMMQTMFSEMDLPGMRSDLAKVYADTFSASEIKAQSDFYSTAAGQAMLDKQPEIQRRLTELMMPRMMKAMPKVQAMSREFAEQEAALRENTTPAAPTQP